MTQAESLISSYPFWHVQLKPSLRCCFYKVKMLLQLSAAVVASFLHLLIHCHQGPNKWWDCKRAKGKWKLLLLLGQHCFSQRFGLCWLHSHSSYRYKIRRSWDLGAVGGCSRRYSEARWLLALIYSFFFTVGVCNLELLCSSSLVGTMEQSPDEQHRHPCLLVACGPYPTS